MTRWLAIALLSLAVPAAAGATLPAADRLPAAAPAAPAATAADTNAADAAPQLGDDQADPGDTDPEVRALSIQLDREQLRALIGRARFAAATDEYQAAMYRHHQFWTDAAAVAVYLITFFGLACAGIQFRLWARLRGVEVHEDEAASAGAIELPGGAKVNSPFLGVIILFLSLAFFYLYLTNVYPILSVAEIEAKRAAASAKPQ